MAIPTTMRALVAPRKCGPEDYEVIELPVPSVTLPTHVLLKVHAAAANTGELQAFDGRFGLLYTPKYVLLLLNASTCPLLFAFFY